MRSHGSISGDLHALEKVLGRTRHAHEIGNEQMRVIYEAGPCGYVIVRRLRQLGIDCVVIAPSIIPKMPIDEMKTDKRARTGGRHRPVQIMCAKCSNPMKRIGSLARAPRSSLCIRAP